MLHKLNQRKYQRFKFRMQATILEIFDCAFLDIFLGLSWWFKKLTKYTNFLRFRSTSMVFCPRVAIQLLVPVIQQLNKLMLHFVLHQQPYRDSFHSLWYRVVQQRLNIPVPISLDPYLFDTWTYERTNHTTFTKCFLNCLLFIVCNSFAFLFTVIEKWLLEVKVLWSYLPCTSPDRIV